jgi:hypothetical protein
MLCLDDKKKGKGKKSKIERMKVKSEKYNDFLVIL